MNKTTYISASAVAFWMLSISLALADAPAVSVQALSPGDSVFANTALTFNIVATGFAATWYKVSDSLATSSSISSENISGAGMLSWVPHQSDVGTHVLTLTASDNSGNSVSTTQTITVMPAPYLSVQSLSPGHSLFPGTQLSFVVTAPGFTNPSYIAGDAFSGSTVGDPNIDASGNFKWTPDVSQNGQHTITIYGSDSLGHHASVDVAVQVGAGPSITVQALSPGATVAQGQSVTFTVTPTNYVPTSFALTDSFPSSTLSNNSINTLGAFAWTPLNSDFGIHVITITGIVGVYGQSATTSQTITVLGPNGAVPPSASAASGTTTGTTTGTTIGALQSQLALLQAQLAAHAAGATSTAPAGFVFSLALRAGSDGNEVLMLQNVLAGLGLLTAAPNGHFGPATAAAVVKFQAAHDLPQLGVVGPATRAALNALSASTGTGTSAPTSTGTSAEGDGFVFNNFIGPGDNGTDVLELQKRLTVLGFLTVQPNGHFGPATEEAVKQFQSAHGIRAAGYVGPSTRAALNQ